MVFIPDCSEGAAWCCPELAGSKLLTLGGGNAAGQFTVDALKAIQSDLHLIPEANYSGVVFDVEEAVGNGEDLKEAFEETLHFLGAADLLCGGGPTATGGGIATMATQFVFLLAELAAEQPTPPPAFRIAQVRTTP